MINRNSGLSLIRQAEVPEISQGSVTTCPNW